jgi:integrase
LWAAWGVGKQGSKVFQRLGIRTIGQLRQFPLDVLQSRFGSSGERLLRYARQKTGIKRRIPLWSETVSALKEAIAKRPQPHDPADTNLVFLTVFGQRWVRYEVVEEKHHGKKEIKAKLDDATHSTESISDNPLD